MCLDTKFRKQSFKKALEDILKLLAAYGKTKQYASAMRDCKKRLVQYWRRHDVSSWCSASPQCNGCPPSGPETGTNARAIPASEAHASKKVFTWQLNAIDASE